jgi:hypothetical protein
MPATHPGSHRLATSPSPAAFISHSAALPHAEFTPPTKRRPCRCSMMGWLLFRTKATSRLILHTGRPPSSLLGPTRAVLSHGKSTSRHTPGSQCIRVGIRALRPASPVRLIFWSYGNCCNSTCGLTTSPPTAPSQVQQTSTWQAPTRDTNYGAGLKYIAQRLH